MTAQHHPVHRVPVPPARPARCLRHHVWMAACDDCRAARRPRPRGRVEADAG